MFFQIARENILLLINNIHEKMIKNRMFRRHLPENAYPRKCAVFLVFLTSARVDIIVYHILVQISG